MEENLKKKKKVIFKIRRSKKCDQTLRPDLSQEICSECGESRTLDSGVQHSKISTDMGGNVLKMV